MSSRIAPTGRRTFRIGTRGSRLALRQTEIVLGGLQRVNSSLRFEVKPVRTAGDKRARASLSEIGGRGLFVAELERALLSGEIDIAVHSLKDMPSQITDGLFIAAVPPRGDVRDAFVSRGGLKLAQMPAGSTIGTGSPRRAAQLRAYRPDLSIVDIRGNVDTRLRKVERGEYDGVVLAAAGLARLALLEGATEVLSLDVMLPAVGQGALALETRADDPEAIGLAHSIDDADAHAAASAERALERCLGGGCHAAVAALATVGAGTLRLRGLVADLSGRRLLRGEIEGSAAEAEPLGTRLAEQLIGQGATALLEAAS